MNCPFSILNDTNADGVDFVRITTMPNEEHDEAYDICLTSYQLEDFIDALRFIGKRLK